MRENTQDPVAARRRLALTAALLLAAVPACDCGGGHGSGEDAAVADAGASSDAAVAEDAISVQVLAFNDFHGQLRSSANWETMTGPVPAGGAVYLATHVATRRAENPNTVLVSAGDLIGGSPLLSGLYHDEPTIEVMNLLGLDINAVGNHELDEGVDELLRMQQGGCHPVDGCYLAEPFSGASFAFLSASMISLGTDQLIFPPYEVKRFEGVDVAFIGVLLENVAATTTPITGVRFESEAEAVNALVPELQAQGIEAIVVVMHQGGGASGPANTCIYFDGTVAEIVPQLDPAVDVVITGHTHGAYICNIEGVTVTGAGSKGLLLTDLDLRIDRSSGDVVSARAENVVVTQDVAPDPAVEALIAEYEGMVAPLAERIVGTITADLTRATDDSGESALGNLVGDAQLAATSGEAVFALQNSSGLRADLTFVASGAEQDGEVTFAEAFAVHPFGNVVTTLTLSGQQLHDLLEAQWPGPKTLQVSSSLRYTWHRQRDDGDRVDPVEVFIDGAALNLTASYRVAVNDFLATSTEGRWQIFSEGADPSTVMVDIDALEAYLQDRSPVSSPPQDRITVVD